MRKGFDGLYALVRDRLELEPLSGHVFLFSNAQRNRLKLVSGTAAGYGYVRNGWRAGVFDGRAEVGQTKVVVSHEEMALLLGGIDLAGSRRRAWFRKIVSDDSTTHKTVEIAGE